jgi:hypothetical protein
MFSRKIKKKVQSSNSKIKTVLFGICFFFIAASSYAQCAMCRAALSGDENKAKAAAVAIN